VSIVMDNLAKSGKRTSDISCIVPTSLPSFPMILTVGIPLPGCQRHMRGPISLAELVDSSSYLMRRDENAGSM
jgi:hypothetical protein